MRYLELTVGWDLKDSAWTGFYRGTVNDNDPSDRTSMVTYGLRLGRFYIYIGKGV